MHERNLSMSQIEHARHCKRDYSPIITTSKYDLKHIYDPLGHSQHPPRPNRTRNRITARANSHGPRTRRLVTNSMRTTKTDLQRQLHIKQKQLKLIRA